jgi:hypothetical protein
VRHVRPGLRSRTVPNGAGAECRPKVGRAATQTREERLDLRVVLVRGIAAFEQPGPESRANRARFVLTDSQTVGPSPSRDVLVHIDRRVRVQALDSARVSSRNDTQPIRDGSGLATQVTLRRALERAAIRRLSRFTSTGRNGRSTQGQNTDAATGQRASTASSGSGRGAGSPTMSERLRRGGEPKRGGS